MNLTSLHPSLNYNVDTNTIKQILLSLIEELNDLRSEKKAGETSINYARKFNDLWFLRALL